MQQRGGRIFTTVVGVLVGVTLCGTVAADHLPPRDLRVEGFSNPIAIDRHKPAFSWKMNDNRRGAAQIAFRILAASRAELLAEDRADLWDSGKVASDQSLYIPYAGKALTSGQQIVWTVRVWDQDGVASPYSEAARFQMAFLNPADWSAKWIRATGISSVSNDVTNLWMRMAAVPHEVKEVNIYTRKLMGLLEPAPLLRREFTLPSKPVRAVLYACGLGYSEKRINGKKVSDGFFEPAISHYTERAFYNTFDVTAMLNKGANTLGMILGDGWYYEPLAWAGAAGRRVYGRPVATAQLVMEMESGKTITIRTDRSWKSAPGPILKNHYYIGECYDAKALPSGWDLPGFDDSGWSHVEELSEPPTKRLQAQKIETEKVVRRVTPVSVSSPAEGVWVFDMGELLVGFPEIRVPDDQTRPLVVRFAEWKVNPEQANLLRRVSRIHYDGISDARKIPGMIASKTRGMGFLGRGGPVRIQKLTRKKTGLRWRLATPTLVYRADGRAARWHPRFAVFPYRYIEVQGLKSAPDLDFLEGFVVHTALEPTGTFTSSEKLYEEIYEASLNSTLYTLHAMTWDNGCERAQLPLTHSEVFPLAAMSCNNRATAEKLVEDLRFLRGADGRSISIPYTQRGVGAQRNSKALGAKYNSSEISLPWQLYLYYGDKRILAEHFAYIELTLNHYYGPNNPYQADRHKWLRGGGYTSHLSSYMSREGEPDPVWDDWAYHSTWMYDLVRKAAQIASVLGKADKEQEYNALADNIRAEFIKEFPTTDNQGYGGLKLGEIVDSSLGNMIGNAYAVSSGIVPDEDRALVISNLARIMREQYHGHPVCGPQSISRILRILSDNGDVDLAAAWMKSTAHPSYGYMLSFGHKTIWEGFSNVHTSIVGANSIVQSEFQNGANWFQETLCGVRADPNGPGMKHFFIEPKIPSHVASAGTEFENAYGKVKSSWSQSNGVVTWEVCVPPNSTATVVFPESVPLQSVTESGQPLNQAVGVTFAGSSEAKLQSGTYRFRFESV